MMMMIVQTVMQQRLSHLEIRTMIETDIKDELGDHRHRSPDQDHELVHDHHWSAGGG